jgi:ABC-type multidrug transport system fused ATPase/permease subunit
LANIILRILDFDDGELLINGSPIERYNPFEFHTHLTAVFQSFSKHGGTARENIGIGYVDDIDSTSAVSDAVELARASHIIDSLPDGLNTKLDISGFFNTSFLPANLVGMGAGERPSYIHHGMSGGEVRIFCHIELQQKPEVCDQQWQRIAISRAFMRARRPEVNLLLFDEPVCPVISHSPTFLLTSLSDIFARLSCAE